MPTYAITKTGIKKRVSPTTTVKKAEIKKHAEALKKKTPEEQAKILAKTALKKELIPRGRPVWAVPPPRLANEPANQPYISERTKRWEDFGKKAGLALLAPTVKSFTGAQRASFVAPLVEQLTGRAFAHAEQYIPPEWTFGYGMAGANMLAPNHPAHYRLPTTSDKGTPFNPIYRSMEMVNAY